MRLLSLRRELLLALGALFLVAILVAIMGLAILLPVLASAGQAILFMAVLVTADLVVLFLFGRALLRSTLLDPLDRVVEGTRQIADGEYHRRIDPPASKELRVLAGSVNALADRLIHDQELLARNVASLEETNRALMEARDEVARNARLASAGTLAAGIAHEVGNPLGAILGYVDVLRNRLERTGQDPELVEEIRREAERIDRILRGILEYVRPRSAPAGPAPVADVVGRVRELLENQGKLEGVTAEWRVEGDLPHVADPHRLEQVLVNLLLNAVHALKTSGAAEGEVRRIEVAVSSEPGRVARMPRRRESDPPGVDYAHRRRLPAGSDVEKQEPTLAAEELVLITVRDNGPGIEPEHLDRLFDPFFTTKPPGEGTGLGLAVCARLVEGVGGRIDVDSAPGEGAVFTVRIPGVLEDAHGAGDEAPFGEADTVEEEAEA